MCGCEIMYDEKTDMVIVKYPMMLKWLAIAYLVGMVIGIVIVKYMI